MFPNMYNIHQCIPMYINDKGHVGRVGVRNKGI